jgi:proteasome accessory factor B
MKAKHPTSTKKQKKKSNDNRGKRPSKPAIERMRDMYHIFLEGRRDPYRKLPTQKELAELLKVSKRMIQRDIEYMRDRLSLPVYPIRSRGGIGFTEDVGPFPLLAISEGELLALSLARKAMNAHRNLPFGDKLASAFDKLTAALRDELNIDLDAFDSVIDVRPAASETPVDMKTFDTLARAALEKKEVELEYSKLEASGAKPTPERRRVYPLRLVWSSGAWYLINFDPKADDVRNFALVRMQNVEAKNRTFKLPRPYDITRMLDDTFGIFTSMKPVKVRLRFKAVAARIVSERRYHSSQVLYPLQPNDQGEEQIEMSLKVPESPEFKTWVLGWGSKVEVLEPATLRQSIFHEATALMKNHSSPG